MQLTKEQQYILDLVRQGEPLIKILAFAGSGKTTILKEIAKANPDKKMLYLAFNKAIQVEANKKFPKNTEVRTTHSLAYKYIVSRNNYKVRNGDYRLVELKKILAEEDWAILKYTKALLKTFFNTDYDSVEEAYNKRHSNLFENAPEGIDKSRVKELTIQLYTLMKTGTVEITHDFYLKEFQLKLKKKEVSIKPYDVILLDEAQDLNKVVFNIFKYLPAKQKVVVGDNHQSIYSFRGAVNALNKFKDAKTAYLTTSFRLIPDIATYATHILKNLKLEDKALIGGNKKREYDIQTTAYISRTNSGLINKFSHLLEYHIPLTKIKFVRHPYEIFGLLLNLQKFKMGKDLDESYQYLLNYEANSLSELNKKAKEADDKELISAIRVLNILSKCNYNIFELYKQAVLGYNYNKDKEAPYVLLTAHTSKGLEFDKVVLLAGFSVVDNVVSLFQEKGKEVLGVDELFMLYTTDEIAAKIIGTIKGYKNPSVIEEFNLFYVAVTRARYEIELNRGELKIFFKSNSLKEFLDNFNKEMMI